MSSNMKENTNFKIKGFLKIFDPESEKVFFEGSNAIHFENFSIALAQSISNQGEGAIAEMVFGNGGTRVDPTGIITYLTPNNAGVGSSLYNQTYYKAIDGNRQNAIDSSRNFMETRHIAGTPYSDVLISCLLDFGEPSGQDAFDNSSSSEGAYVFDELGLRAYSPVGPNTGMLLTHVIFHPVQKSLNRMIQIDYTIRIQSITTGI